MFCMELVQEIVDPSDPHYSAMHLVSLGILALYIQVRTTHGCI